MLGSPTEATAHKYASHNFDARIRGNQITVDFDIDKDLPGIEITATAKTFGKTGVEMEALTGASVASLTVYDMCKAISQKMVIKEVKLVEKTGGKSDYPISTLPKGKG